MLYTNTTPSKTVVKDYEGFTFNVGFLTVDFGIYFIDQRYK
jgi:hypothetical protein